MFLEERSDGRLQGGDNVIVSRFLAAPYRNKRRVQKVQGGEENLPNTYPMFRRRGRRR